MSAPLVQHVADTLNLTEEEARSRLEAAVSEVKHQVSHGEEVHIPELGTFSKSDGGLTFTPTSALEREINHRFAGLTPVSVSSSEAPSTDPQPEDDADETLSEPPSASPPAPDQSDESAEQQAEEEWHPPEPDDSHHPLGPKETPPYEEPEHTVLDEDEDESRPAEDDEDEWDMQPWSEEESAAELETDQSDTTSEPPTSEEDATEQASAAFEATSEFGPPPSNEPEQTEPADQKTKEPDAEAEPDEHPVPSTSDEDALSEWPEEKSDDVESAPSEEPSEPERSERTTRQPRTRERSSGARILIGLFLVIVLAGGGWYLLQQQGLLSGSGSSDTPAQSASTAQSESSPPTNATDPSTSAPTEPASENGNGGADTGGEASATDAELQSDQTDQAASALGGIDRSAGGFTIVVASRVEQAAAEELLPTYRQRFADVDLPIDILVGESNGQTRYRVSVGQFPSIDAASTNIDRFSDRLPDGAWVHRIRPES